MASNKIINIKDNSITNWNSQITGHQVTVVYSTPKKERPKNIWFQMRDTTVTFSGRNTELEDIHTTLCKCKSFVIYGLAGIGKTELARFYAWKHSDFYNKNVIWIHAEDLDNLKESFRKLATELEIPVGTNGFKRDDLSVIHEIYSYFGEDKCLFVFDNVRTREDIATYLPSRLETNLNIHILITSQNSEWGQLNCLQLFELSKTDAVQLMVKCLKNILITEREIKDIEKLVELLQCLPLALQEAAAYIEDRNSYVKIYFSVSDYIRKFKTEGSLLNVTYHGAAFPHYSEHNYRKTVFINISIILKKIKEDQVPLTLDLLYCIAYFAPDEIDLDTFRPLLRDSDDVSHLNEAVRVLKRYSLITTDKNDELHIHRLVQSVIRQHVKLEHLEKYILTKALNLILTEEEKYSINSSYLLKFAHEEELLYDYYKNCKNKKIFWFCLVRMEPSDIACSMLQIITDVNYFKDDDIISVAATTNNIGLVKLLIERGANVNTPNKYSRTPVSLAAEDGTLTMLRYLIDSGADINKLDDWDRLPLTYAVIRHDLEMIKYLIEAGTKLNLPNISVLHEAANMGFIDVIKILLDRGLDVNSKFSIKTNSIFSRYFPTERKSQTALDWAASSGKLATVQYLLNKGARLSCEDTLNKIIERGRGEILKYFINTAIYDVNNIPWNSVIHFARMYRYELLTECFFEFCPNSKDYFKSAAFHGHLEILKFLIEAREHLHEEFEDSELIHFAVEGNQLNIVKYLTSKNINVNQINDTGNTALILAAVNGYTDIVILLCESGANPNIYENFDSSPIYLALANYHTEIVKYLVTKGAHISEKTDIGATLIQVGAHLGLLDIVCFFKERGLPVNKADNFGNTALHEASSNNHIYIMNYLIKHGANVNQPNKEGKTPLFLACEGGHIDAVNCLIAHGANVNQCMNTSESVLQIASLRTDTNIIQCLIENGANLSHKNQDGISCQFYAAGQGNLEIIEIFLRKGMNVFEKTSTGVTLLHFTAEVGQLEVVKYLVRKGANVNERNNLGETPLIWACSFGKTEVVKYLLEQGAHVNDKTINGNSALEYAATSGNLDIVKMLVDSQADIFLQNKNGDTALHEACKNGHTDIVAFLYYKGCDINKKNKNKCTPLHLAVENNHASLVKFLVEQKADIRKKNKNGLTPIKLADLKNLNDIVRYFTALKVKR